MNAGSLDTNVLVRLLVKDVPTQHEAAVKLMTGVRGKLDIADTALIELAFVLERYYQLSRADVREALEGLLSLPTLNCNRPLFAKALPLFIAHKSLAMEDCCLAAYAELNKAEPLWTFDAKLAKQAPAAQLI